MFLVRLLICWAMALSSFVYSADSLTHLFHNDPEQGDNAAYKFVTLGKNCYLTVCLHNCGLREAAYPFDWIDTSNVNALISVLDNDFLHYTDENSFAKLQNQLPSYLNTFYGLGFPHDFSGNPHLSYEESLKEWIAFKLRYERRVISGIGSFNQFLPTS